IEPEDEFRRLARRCACLADAREEEAEVCAAMGPSLFPWGSWETPRHDDTRRSHVLGQFPQGRPTPSPYQTTTPSTSHPNSSSALGGSCFHRDKCPDWLSKRGWNSALFVPRPIVDFGKWRGSRSSLRRPECESGYGQFQGGGWDTRRCEGHWEDMALS